MVSARRFTLIALRRLAGFAVLEPPATTIEVDTGDVVDRNRWLYRPVQLLAPTRGILLPTRGSGDIVSAARSDGFVEIPPNSAGVTHRPFFPWRP